MNAEPRVGVGPAARPIQSGVDRVWARRRDISVTLVVAVALVGVVFWLAGHFAGSLIIIVMATLIAYALYPAVRALARVMPRVLATLIVYLLFLGALAAVGYFVTNAAVDQLSRGVSQIRDLLTPASHGADPPLIVWLKQLGVTQDQIDSVLGQLASQGQTIVTGAVPIIGGVFVTAFNLLLTLILSVYLVNDGHRIGGWLQRQAPTSVQPRLDYFLDALQRIVGGYIRSQFVLSILSGILTGAIMLAFGVPYAMLLGVVAFLLQFIPVTGSPILIVVCTLVALGQGWQVAIGVFVAVVAMRILLDNVLGPRISGKAVGLHPAVAIAAVIIGGEVWGVWGVLLAAPVAGLLQAIGAYLWFSWRETHPEDFTSTQVSELVAEEEAGVVPVIVIATETPDA